MTFNPLPKEVLDAIEEHDPDFVEIRPTAFGEGTFYRVDRRTDPPSVSLHDASGELYKGDESTIRYDRFVIKE